MAYCGPRGIPLEGEFLKWSRADQNHALAWEAHENRRCRSCGTHPEEWAEDKLAYHAHLTECRGCKQLQRLAKTEEAHESEGRAAVMAGGSAAHCSRCAPMD